MNARIWSATERDVVHPQDCYFGNHEGDALLKPGYFPTGSQKFLGSDLILIRSLLPSGYFNNAIQWCATEYNIWQILSVWFGYADDCRMQYPGSIYRDLRYYGLNVNVRSVCAF